VLGFVWAVNARSCYSRCPKLLFATFSALALSVTRVMSAFLALRLLLSREVRRRAREAPKVEGASEEQIDALHLVRFSDEFTGSHSSCAVCLSEYCDGDVIRELPCHHQFHRKCADPWLAKSKRCPLCMQAIDEVHPDATWLWPCRHRKQA